MGIWEWDILTDCIVLSDEVEPLFGREVGSTTHTYAGYLELVHPDDRVSLTSTIGAALASDVRDLCVEHRVLWPDGSLHWIACKGRVFRAAGGQPLRVLGTVLDITDCRAASEALEREREASAEQLRRANRTLLTISRCHQALIRASDETELLAEVCRIIVDVGGYRMARVELVDRAGPPVADDAEREPSLILPLVSTEPLGSLVVTAQGGRPGGEELTLLAQLADDLAFALQARRTQRAHLESERALAASRELLCFFIKHCPAAVAMFDCEMRYLQASDRWLNDYGLAGQAILGRSHYEVFPDIPDAWKQVHQRVLAGAAESCDDDPFPRADGTVEWLQWDVRPWRQASGTVGGLIMFTQVITQRKRVEAELRASQEDSRESQARLRQLADNLREVVWLSSTHTGECLYVSSAFRELWGLPCELLQERPLAWLDAVHPEDRARVQAALSRRHRGSYDEEYRVVRPDGTVRLIHERAFPIHDADGVVYRLAGVAEDITERRRIEEQYRHAQKMDAIGQLAGGIAHDFNNIVNVIMVNAEMIGELEGLSTETREMNLEVRNAAERAARLTRQLLAFSRKQVLDVRSTDLNETVTGIARMLERVLHKHVRLKLALHPEPLWIEADGGMLDQVLLNLAVNARDAMPQGGQLDIATGVEEIEGTGPIGPGVAGELSPGTYVRLRVSDSGCGIAPEHMSRIFEPFFTTKDPGKGTGLGLATVFGIVRQHHGVIAVTSTPGRGTTFTIYLPMPAPGDQGWPGDGPGGSGTGGVGHTIGPL